MVCGNENCMNFIRKVTRENRGKLRRKFMDEIEKFAVSKL